MKIYLAKADDTLRSISEKYQLEIESLHSANPHISNPDINIAGEKIKIPSSRNLDIPPSSFQVLEPWIPLTTLPQMAQTEYDVLIIGTGAGGGAVLWRLCEEAANKGKRIGVIEAGDLYLPTHAMNLPTFDHQKLQKFWEKAFIPGNPSTSNNVSRMKRFYALGGRTLLWGTVSPRMDHMDIKEWPVTFEELDRYYRIAEQKMSVTVAYTKGSAITEILLQLLQENGYPEARDMPVAANLEPTKYGEIQSNVFFSSIQFLAEAMNKQPFDLAVKSRAVRVMMDRDQAVGVQVFSTDRISHHIKAKTIVLAASTLETPRILLNSGIQGNAIGRYLTNHSRILATAKVKRTDFPEVMGTLNILIPKTRERPYQILLFGPGEYFGYHFKEMPLREEWEIFYYAFGEIESRFENRVLLDPNHHDQFGVPDIRIDFSFSKRDQVIIKQLAEAIKQTSAVMKAPLIAKEGEPVLSLSSPWEVGHEMGTCRIGNDPLTSVCNPFGQVHGIPNLYVAGNSVIPSSGAANPTLTSVALAIRTADHIVKQWKE